jgi:hypothetical protein
MLSFTCRNGPEFIQPGRRIYEFRILHRRKVRKLQHSIFFNETLIPIIVGYRKLKAVRPMGKATYYHPVVDYTKDIATFFKF